MNSENQANTQNSSDNAFLIELLEGKLSLNQNTKKEEILKYLKILSYYLSKIEVLEDKKTKRNLKSFFDSVKKFQFFSAENINSECVSISYLICCFIDFIGIQAPEFGLEEEELEFYIVLTIKWLDNYQMNIEEIPKQLELKFDYILEQLGKRNIFALLSTVGLEENVYDVCEILFQIQSKKRYEKNSSNFYNIYRIIKGVIEDSNVSTETLSLILTKLNKKEKKETFDLVYYLLTEMKNILANPINQLIFKIIKYDLDSNANFKSKNKKATRAKKSSNKNLAQKDKDDIANIEIFNIPSEKFLYLLKKLSNISHEYLVNFYSSLQLNESFTEAKTKGITHFEILSKLIKSKNSISIAENYEKAFNFFLNLVYKKNTRDIDKFKIFSALVKFNYKNAKERLKKSGLKKSTTNIIFKFIDEIKNESIIFQVLYFIKNKYLKGKKISNKIIEHMISKFSSLKNKKIYEALIQQNLHIIQKKLILNSSNFDLISNDFRRKIEKTSYFLRETLTKFSELEENSEQANIFELNFMKFLIDTVQRLSIRKNFDYEGNLEAFLKIFYISSFDNKSYNILLKYFIFCGEANKKMKNFLTGLNTMRKSKKKLSLDDEASEANQTQNNFGNNSYFENRFFDKQNLNVFDKIEILFYDRIKLNPDRPSESEPTAILIDDFSRGKLSSSFLSLFCFENSENFSLAKKLENLETIVSFAEDKLAKSLNKIFLLKKINDLNNKGSKTKSKLDIIDLIEKENYLSDEENENKEEEEKELSGNDSDNQNKEKLNKGSKSKNNIVELNLEINHRFKFTVEDIVYIFKAFLFELETENISFLDSLGDLFINDIEIADSKEKLNNKIDKANKKADKDASQSFSQTHLLFLLKSILTTFYFFIKNVFMPLKAENKQNNLLNENDISKISNLKSEIKENPLDRSNLNLEGGMNQMNISANFQTTSENENGVIQSGIPLNFLNQKQIKINIENINQLGLSIKNHLFSIFHFLKKILINNINQEDIVNLVIIISKNLYCLDDENIKLNILNFVKRELTNFCFESCENSIKSLADFFLKINKGESFYYIPERLEYYLKSEKYNLTSLRFINYLIKLEFENQEIMQKLRTSSANHDIKSINNFEKLRSLIFREDIIDYLENNFTKSSINIDYKKDVLIVDLNNIHERNALGNKFKRLIVLKHEIYKFYMHYLILLESNPKKKEENVIMTEEKNNNLDKSDLKTENNNENNDDANQTHNLKKFMKVIFTNLDEQLDEENILFNIKDNKLVINEKIQIRLYILENSSDLSSQSEEDSEYIDISKLNLKEIDLIKKHKITEKDLLMKNNYINQFRMMEICKYISLVFLLADFKQNVDLKNQIRLSNLALNRELLIRSYLLKKIEKILLRKNSIYQYINIIQILILYLNEPNKDLNKKGLVIFGKFINFICKKFNQYKHLINGENKTYFYYYKYIPETYITYLIMYIVFNPNLIKLAQLYEKKFFQELIKKFLKILKKSTNGVYDSSFMLGILIQIKDLELINTKNKFISLISTYNNNTYLDKNKGKGKLSVFNQISADFKAKITEFNFESYNQTKNFVCDLAMDIIKLNFDTKIKYENVKPLIPVIFYTKEYINKNNFNFNPNNFNLFNLFNNTNNFTFLNGLNPDASNANNTTYPNILGNLEINDDESKGRNIYYENTMRNNRLTLENFVKKNNNNNKSIINNNENFSKKMKNLQEKEMKIENNNNVNINKALRKKVKSEIEDEEKSDKQDDGSDDMGNFDASQNHNKKAVKIKKKTKIKNAPLKLYANDEENGLKLENEKEIQDKQPEDSADELEILPYYKKYKNKQKYKGVIADQETYNYHDIEDSANEHENDNFSSDEDVGNFDMTKGKKTKKIKNIKNQGKKKANNEENNNKNKKKKKGT